MEGYNKDRALARYSELNRREDMLFLQIQHRAEGGESIPWTEEQVQLHAQILEMEQEALRNGYILSVAWDSVFCAEDTCKIRPMTASEAQEFLVTDQYPRGRTELEQEREKQC